MVAVVAAYYFFRFEPHWTNRNNTRTQIAKSIRQPENTTEVETSPAPQKIEISVSAPKIEKVDRIEEPTAKEQPVSNDQPQPIIIARASSPPVSSPKDTAETAPPSNAAPASLPEGSNGPEDEKQGKRSYESDGQETVDTRTEDATGDTIATDPSVTGSGTDSQQPFLEKTIEDSREIAALDEKEPNLQDERPRPKEVSKPEPLAAKEKPKEEGAPTQINATSENSTAPLPVDYKNDSQPLRSDETAPPSTERVALADNPTTAPKNNTPPSENATAKSDSAAAKKKSADASSTTEPRRKHQEQSSTLALKERPLEPNVGEQTPAPQTAAPEKQPPVNLPETTIVSKSDAPLEEPTNRSGARSAPVEGSDIKPMEDQLRSFLNLYCRTYAEKDLNGFTSFFTANALENGKPFESLLPKYKRNFTYIDQIQYRIELQQFSYDESEDTVKIEGDFF
jgi:hypothetical protein